MFKLRLWVKNKTKEASRKVPLEIRRIQERWLRENEWNNLAFSFLRKPQPRARQSPGAHAPAQPARWPPGLDCTSPPGLVMVLGQLIRTLSGEVTHDLPATHERSTEETPGAGAEKCDRAVPIPSPLPLGSDTLAVPRQTSSKLPTKSSRKTNRQRFGKKRLLKSLIFHLGVILFLKLHHGLFLKSLRFFSEHLSAILFSSTFFSLFYGCSVDLIIHFQFMYFKTTNIEVLI